MNVTFSVDARTVEQTRDIARSQGKSLNRLIRDYLDFLTQDGDRETEIEELLRLSIDDGGATTRWQFNREKLNGRT